MTLTDLRPGDILLYGQKSFWGWVIRVKSWSSVSHAEIYLGEGRSIGSREAHGVATYDFMQWPKYVVRPPAYLNLDALLAWHASVEGKGYDYWGLLAFFNVGHGVRDRYICSEHTTLAMRAGGVEFFRPAIEAQKVSPGMFLTSPVGLVIPWEAL